GDLGAEDRDGSFLPLRELGLFPGIPYDENEVLRLPEGYAPLPLRECAGLTVNRVNGTAASITAVRKYFPDAQVESMEGAAFFHTCLLAGLEPVELRAISNYVEPRNRKAWKIGEAIGNLNAQLRTLLGAFLEVS
ncbi:MAG: futalosine hydrolase, partial [Bacteroidota bacterium]